MLQISHETCQLMSAIRSRSRISLKLMKLLSNPPGLSFEEVDVGGAEGEEHPGSNLLWPPGGLQ